MTNSPRGTLAPRRAVGSRGLLVSPLCLGGNVFGWTRRRSPSAASNFTADRLREAYAVSMAEGLTPYVAVQNHYNLMERRPYEDDIPQLLSAMQLASFPYFGLARGFLTGKYRPGAIVDSPRAGGAQPYMGPHGERVLVALARVAAAHDMAMAAIALAWLLSRPGVTAPLASARNTRQFAELVPMASVVLSDDDLATLDTASW